MSSLRSGKLAHYLLIVGLTLFAFALRFLNLDRMPFRGDEAFTVIHWMREPLASTLAMIATVDPQPPLAYALFRGWALLFGTTEFTARALPALLSVAGVPLIAVLGQRLISRRAGIVAAFLWALHPYLLWHAQDARNYALWSTFSLLSLWLAHRALHHQRFVDWALFVLAALLAAYTYYLELFVLFAITLYVVLAFYRQRIVVLRWFAALTIIGLGLAPWHLQERLLFGSGYGGTTSGFQVARLWSEFLPTLTFGVTLPQSLVDVLWPVLVLLLSSGVVVLFRRRPASGVLVGLLGVVPLVLLGVVSLRLNVFTPRYVLATAPAFVLAFSALVIIPSWRSLRRFASFARAGLLSLWILVSIYALSYYFSNDYAKSADWRTLSQYLAAHAQPTDLIVQAAADEALNYYYDQTNVTAARKQLPANPLQSTAEIYGILYADLLQRRAIWRVARTWPDWPNVGVVENWLAANMQQVRATTINDQPVQQYLPWWIAPWELEAEPRAIFSDVAALASATVLPESATPGKLTVWLYWQPLARSSDDLKVFVQLLGPLNPTTGSPLWSQDDQYPQDGRVQTTTWSPQIIYRDVYELPMEDVPAGEYQLVAGLYDPTTGERVPVVGQSEGYVILQSIAFVG